MPKKEAERRYSEEEEERQRESELRNFILLNTLQRKIDY